MSYTDGMNRVLAEASADEDPCDPVPQPEPVFVWTKFHQQPNIFAFSPEVLEAYMRTAVFQPEYLSRSTAQRAVRELQNTVYQSPYRFHDFYDAERDMYCRQYFGVPLAPAGSTTNVTVGGWTDDLDEPF